MNIPEFYRCLQIFKQYFYRLLNVQYYSIYDLQGRVGETNGDKLLIDSYYANGLYPNAKMYGVKAVWSSTTAKSSHDGVTVHSPTVPWDGTQAGLAAYFAKTGETDPAGTGCWLIRYNEPYVEMAGATADGSTVDDSVAFNQISNVVGDAGGGTVHFTGRYLIDSNVTIREYVHFRGGMGIPDQLRYQTPREYDTKKSTLIVNSAATITPLDGGAVGGCIVIRKGLSLPFADATEAAAGIAAFAGNAFTVGGTGNYFYNMLVLGFDKAIYGIGYPRVRCTYIIGDCTNGIDIQGALDVCHLDKCHFWPFTTTHQTGFPAELTVRSGFGFRYKDTADWCKMEYCFSYGYDAGGTIIDSCNSVELWGGGADFFNGLTPTQPGLQVIGSTEDLFADSFRSTYAVGALVNSTTSRNAATLCITCHNNATAGVRVLDGYTTINNSVLRINPLGIDIDPNSDGARVDGNSFYSSTEPIKASGAGLRKSHIGPNTFTNCIDLTIGRRDNRYNQHAVDYFSTYGTGVNGPTLIAEMARGTVDAMTASASGDVPYNRTARVYGGTAHKDIGSIKFFADGTPSDASAPGGFSVSLTPSGGTTPTKRLNIGNNGFAAFTGSLGFGTPAIKTADFTVGENENFLINNKSGSANTVTLPDPAAYSGRLIVFTNRQNQPVNSASANVTPINSATPGTSILPAIVGAHAILVSNGTNWVTVSYEGVGAKITGWGADTGTAKRTTNATYSGTAEGAYTQATIQALMDSHRDLSQTVKALKDDLITQGSIGT
jgi:hypothetical protein